MTKFQIKEKIRKHIESLNLNIRTRIILFEVNDCFQILARVNFRICNDDFDHTGEILITKRELQLILTPSEYEQFVQLIVDDIKS